MTYKRSTSAIVFKMKDKFKIVVDFEFNPVKDPELKPLIHNEIIEINRVHFQSPTSYWAPMFITQLASGNLKDKVDNMINIHF